MYKKRQMGVGIAYRPAPGRQLEAFSHAVSAETRYCHFDRAGNSPPCHFGIFV